MERRGRAKRRGESVAELIAGVALVTVFAAVVLVLLGTVPEVLFWLSVVACLAVVATEWGARLPLRVRSTGDAPRD